VFRSRKAPAVDEKHPENCAAEESAIAARILEAHTCNELGLGEGRNDPVTPPWHQIGRMGGELEGVTDAVTDVEGLNVALTVLVVVTDADSEGVVLPEEVLHEETDPLGVNVLEPVGDAVTVPVGLRDAVSVGEPVCVAVVEAVTVRDIVMLGDMLVLGVIDAVIDADTVVVCEGVELAAVEGVAVLVGVAALLPVIDGLTLGVKLEDAVAVNDEVLVDDDVTDRVADSDADRLAVMLSLAVMDAEEVGDTDAVTVEVTVCDIEGDTVGYGDSECDGVLDGDGVPVELKLVDGVPLAVNDMVTVAV
jgi:hypothetical protein